jgi:nucleoside-diphosphate-sugar epimerase
MDLKCFLGTIGSVLMHDGVVEGGTGELNKVEEETEAHKSETAQSSAKKETIAKDTEEREKGRRKKKILITGSGSYVGTSVEAWLRQWPEYYQVDTLDMRTQTWRTHDFSAYDVVYHVAGIAHADVGQVTEEEKKQYYRVNTDLAVETAEKAKKEGVQQFLFMSSMIVYSGCREKKITKSTIPKPLNFYGDSKWQADQKIQALADERFKVVVLRPPMIYGKGSKGNYPQLAKLAGKLPLFPIVHNQRSMLYIENLAQFVKRMIDNEETGVFFPQNEQYINTSDLVQMIAVVKGHRLVMVPATGWIIRLMKKIPGKIGTLTGKAFGDSVYDMQMSEYKEEYRVCDWKESVRRTEG